MARTPGSHDGSRRGPRPDPRSDPRKQPGRKQDGAPARPRGGADARVQDGINRESDVAADLQIGPTSLGMVRIYILGDGVDLPLDFDPDEADEIAEELRAAAARARAVVKSR